MTETTHHSTQTNHLTSLVERIERLDAERQDRVEDIKEVLAEAKGAGFDVAILRKVLARRKRASDDLAEEAALLDLYEAQLDGGE